MSDAFRERHALFAGGILLSLLAASCGTRKDNGLGVGFIDDLGDQKAVRYLSLTPDSAADFQSARQAPNAGSSRAVTVGSQSGYFARSLLQFDQAQLPPAGTVVDSASIQLIYDDGIGAPDSVPVGIHRVTSSWSEAAIPDPFPTVLAAADTVTVRAGEQGDSVKVPLGSLAQFWVDNPDSNQGMALVPADSSELLLEYSSKDTGTPPLLHVYWNVGGVDTSVTVNVTLDNTLLTETPAFVPLDGFPGRLTVGRGIPTSTLVRFPLPDIGDRATVNRAVLTLHLDQAVSNMNTFTFRFQRVTEVPWAGDSTVVDVVAHALTPVSSDQDSARFEVGPLVTSIAKDGNLGILIKAHDPLPDTDFVRFHGMDTGMPALRPNLQVWYTPEQESAP